MSIQVPLEVFEHVTHPDLVKKYERATQWRNSEVHLSDDDLTDDVLADLAAAAGQASDKGFGRTIGSLQAARRGDFSKSIPNLAAAPSIITAYLKQDRIDGWIYSQGRDGHLHPYLVTKVQVTSRQNDDKPYLSISLTANGFTANGSGSSRVDGDGGLAVIRTSETLNADQVTRKKVVDVLATAGLYRETPELKAAYEEALEAYRVDLTKGFAEQFRFTGTTLAHAGHSYEQIEVAGHKVIHDIAPNQIPSFSDYAPSTLFSENDDEDQGAGPVPVHTVLRVFDLVAQEFSWVNHTDLTRYVYDKTLRDKLILPPDQSELLDILTTDISTFTADIIEGKSAGNVILCKGVPGVGKTLSAEVYSELIERPLYAIHSGNLGTNAADIRKNLEIAFKRAKRWNATLLLDEADVFVLERGDNITQNAIVAEFLRTLEYFDGLLFMTTNRANNIDEAIISRTAAIIDYKIPGPEGIRAVWKVQAANNGVTIPDDVLDAIVDGFDNDTTRITPRDIKMLLRLSARVARHNDEPLSVDVFRRASMFRGLHYQG